MTQDDLIKAAHRPVTEQDLIEYKRWRREMEDEFERVAQMQHVDNEFLQRSYS